MRVDRPLEGGVVGEKVACFSSERARISGYKASKEKSKAMQEGKEETEGVRGAGEEGAKGGPLGEQMTDPGNRAWHIRIHKDID